MQQTVAAAAAATEGTVNSRLAVDEEEYQFVALGPFVELPRTDPVLQLALTIQLEDECILLSLAP